MTKVDLVQHEDGGWMGMYIDGLLVSENDSLSAYSALDALKAHVPGLELVWHEEPASWFSAAGETCPAKLPDPVLVQNLRILRLIRRHGNAGAVEQESIPVIRRLLDEQLIYEYSPEEPDSLVYRYYRLGEKGDRYMAEHT